MRSIREDHWKTTLTEQTGYSYFGARYYSPELSVWLSVDPMSDKYPSLSAYNYCELNPVMLVDPDGRSTEVVDNGNGTYKVVGGNLNDKDRGIYVVKLGEGGKYERTGVKLGKSLTMYSFYNEDKQDGKNQVGWKGTINVNSMESGKLVKNL